MALKRLVKTVILRDEDTGQTTTYVKGSTPPAAAAKQITNPAAWGEVVPDKRNRGRKIPEPVADEFGEGPFRERSDEHVLGLAARYGLEVESVDEAIAALEAEGVNPEDAPPPTSSDTNVDG